jgi:hypothetical protein
MIMTTFPPNYNTQASGATDPGNGRSFVKAGFVQTRGSVPLFWTEINNLRYRPDLKIIDLPESVSLLSSLSFYDPSFDDLSVLMIITGFVMMMMFIVGSYEGTFRSTNLDLW